MNWTHIERAMVRASVAPKRAPKRRLAITCAAAALALTALPTCGGKSDSTPNAADTGAAGVTTGAAGDDTGAASSGAGNVGGGQAGVGAAGSGATAGAAGTQGAGGAAGGGDDLGASVVMLAAGHDHFCSLLSDGTVWCWGRNGEGQLGNTSTTTSTDPVQVRNLGGKAVAVAAGDEYSCAVLTDGTAQCWGTNTYGSLGDGSNLSSLVPVTVSGLSGATAIAAGENTACAIVAGGAVSCWGNNYYGALGAGSLSTPSKTNTPVQVLGLTGAKAISGGYGYSCVLNATGGVQCWGYNGFGALGTGASQSSPTPVNVMGISGATAISTGKSHACALLGDGTIRCWGENGSGQLGTGATASSFTPVPVFGVTGAVSVSASFDGSYSCAVVASGKVECWGNNSYQQLGDGTTMDSLMPVLVAGSGLGDAVSVSASAYQACAMFSDGSYQCWGNG